MISTKHNKTQHQLVIAIDFDKTINNSNFPEIGKLYPFAKEVINKWYKQGAYIIISSCRTGVYALEAEAYLLNNRINFHKFNEHHPNGLLNYGSKVQIDHNLPSKKIWSHILIDDTSIEWVLNGHPGWNQLDEMLQTIILNQSESDNPWKIQADDENYTLTEFAIQSFLSDIHSGFLTCVPSENSKVIISERSGKLDSRFNLKDFQAVTRIKSYRTIETLITNIENKDVICDLNKGNYNTFKIDASIFNDCFIDITKELIINQ